MEPQTHNPPKRKKEEVTPTQRMLNTWAIVLIIWALYRHHFKEALPIWIDEFIAKPSIFLIPLYYYILRFELELVFKEHHKVRTLFSDVKAFLHTLGLTLKHWRFDLGVSVLVGFVFMGIGAYANQVKYGSFFNPGSEFLKQYTPYMLITVGFASALWEEILSRGFVLKRLLEEKKHPIYAVFFNSFLYFFTHIPILFTSAQITGYLILQVLAMDIMFSLMVSTFFLYKRSTLLAILVHAFYNLSLYFFL